MYYTIKSREKGIHSFYIFILEKSVKFCTLLVEQDADSLLFLSYFFNNRKSIDLLSILITMYYSRAENAH